MNFKQIPLKLDSEKTFFIPLTRQVIRDSAYSSTKLRIKLDVNVSSYQPTGKSFNQNLKMNDSLRRMQATRK